MFVKPRVHAIKTKVPAAFGKVLIWGYSVKHGDSVRSWPWAGTASFRFALDYALKLAAEHTS